MAEVEEFGGEQAGAPTARRSRQSVAARGGLPDLPVAPQRLPTPQQMGAPRPVARASDGSVDPARHVQDEEAPIFPVVANPEIPAGYRQTDLTGANAFVEHSCGHIAGVKLWRDPARQRAQIAKIEKSGRCAQCAKK
jgi:hypothetical protein